MVHEDEADGEPVVQVACWEGALEHTPTVQGCGEKGRDAGWRVKEALKDMYVRMHCKAVLGKLHKVTAQK